MHNSLGLNSSRERAPSVQGAAGLGHAQLQSARPRATRAHVRGLDQDGAATLEGSLAAAPTPNGAPHTRRTPASPGTSARTSQRRSRETEVEPGQTNVRQLLSHDHGGRHLAAKGMRGGLRPTPTGAGHEGHPWSGSISRKPRSGRIGRDSGLSPGTGLSHCPGRGGGS